MDSILDIIITEEHQNERLDKFLSFILPTFSRTTIQKLIEKELVLVNDKKAKASYKIEENDHIVVYDQEVEDTSINPEDIPLDIIYEDTDLLVINKPKNMVVHPSIGHYKGTLVNALLYHCKDLSTINGVHRPGIVHRIDKDTSGLLVVAKNDFAHSHLQNQLVDKTMYRKYIALVYGKLDHKEGIIDAPIGRDNSNRQKMAVVKDGKESITHFSLIKQYQNYALIECLLKTGRTHQIRVHLDFIKHPVVGDPMYGPKKVIGEIGQYLHATELHFIHPRTNKEMSFNAPLPAYFTDFLDKLN